MANASSVAAGLGTYKRVDVETANQGKLIVMLFNGAIQRAEEAKRHIDGGRNEGAHNSLIRAQEILAELRGALNMKAGRIAQHLDRVYEYAQHLLIKANLQKQGEPIDECVAMLTELRNTWEELFDRLGKETKRMPPPKINQHGESIMNLEG